MIPRGHKWAGAQESNSAALAHPSQTCSRREKKHAAKALPGHTGRRGIPGKKGSSASPEQAAPTSTPT